MREVLDLDEDELAAYAEAVREQIKVDQWSMATQILAEQTTILDAILKRLTAGIPVGITSKIPKPPKPLRIKPPWEKKPDRISNTKGLTRAQSKAILERMRRGLLGR